MATCGRSVIGAKVPLDAAGPFARAKMSSSGALSGEAAGATDFMGATGFTLSAPIIRIIFCCMMSICIVSCATCFCVASVFFFVSSAFCSIFSLSVRLFFVWYSLFSSSGCSWSHCTFANSTLIGFITFDAYRMPRFMAIKQTAFLTNFFSSGQSSMTCSKSSRGRKRISTNVRAYAGCLSLSASEDRIKSSPQNAPAVRTRPCLDATPLLQQKRPSSHGTVSVCSYTLPIK
mmetsp:Transcript_74149/g.211671  ORF Transcript_74149/g.211671 Transcript_74149/m.211671 type:complete len:232 (-) Transcript_74149:408-1103(-)